MKTTGFLQWSPVGIFLLCLLLLPMDTRADSLETIRPLLSKYCVGCHGADEQNARIRFDRLEEFKSSDQHLWTMVHEALANGDMPPKEKLQPSDAEKRQILTWIVQQATRNAEEMNGTQRRLNRREFSAALRDLTGLPIDFAVGIPADAKVDGFDTGATALQDGADTVAQWLEVTRRAVDSIRFLEPASERVIQIDFREHEFTDFRKFVEGNWGDEGVFTRSKRLTCKEEIGLYLPTQWTGDRGDSFLALPVPKDKSAVLKVNLRVIARQPMQGLPDPMLWVKVGGSYIDYRPIGEEPQTLTYAVRLEDCLIEDGIVKIMLRSFVEVPYSIAGFANDDRSKPEDMIPGGIGVYRPAFDRKVLRDPEQQPVPTIVVESIEVDYDHRSQWPPKHWNVAIEDRQDNEKYASAMLNLWMVRAWRRPVSIDEQEKFIALYRRLRGEGLSFDDALRGVFQSVLMGGPFRYLASPTDSDPVVAQYAIASRLSFMLVGEPPDEELRNLAAAGKLRIPSIVDQQVDRLLADPRSMEFYRSFVTQWLNMDQPITLTMSHFKKQDFKFGRNLKYSMKEETVRYVARLFTDNRPAAELVASDWTIMNDILAFHYGVAGVEGAEFRKVILRPNEFDPRGGGILGHSGIQSMLCWMGDNWVIYRGAWALDHILDDPPPPPPLEVPELLPFDKQNQGKSFRELLVQHQADSKCNVCHKKIDPLGFAFQNFDLSGRWRDVEHERYHRSELDGKIEWRGQGETRPVDVKGSLPRGEEFANFQEFKQLLAEKYLDDIVKGILKKLTLYGTGRPANVVDILAIQAIMKEQSDNQYPMQDLLKALIRSRVVCQSSSSPSNG